MSPTWDLFNKKSGIKVGEAEGETKEDVEAFARDHLGLDCDVSVQRPPVIAPSGNRNGKPLKGDWRNNG